MILKGLPNKFSLHWHFKWEHMMFKRNNVSSLPLFLPAFVL